MTLWTPTPAPPCCWQAPTSAPPCCPPLCSPTSAPFTTSGPAPCLPLGTATPPPPVAPPAQRSLRAACLAPGPLPLPLLHLAPPSPRLLLMRHSDSSCCCCTDCYLSTCPLYRPPTPAGLGEALGRRCSGSGNCHGDRRTHNKVGADFHISQHSGAHWLWMH